MEWGMFRTDWFADWPPCWQLCLYQTGLGCPPAVSSLFWVPRSPALLVGGSDVRAHLLLPVVQGLGAQLYLSFAVCSFLVCLVSFLRSMGYP